MMSAMIAWRKFLSKHACHLVLLCVMWIMNCSVDSRAGNLFAGFECVSDASHWLPTGEDSNMGENCSPAAAISGMTETPRETWQAQERARRAQLAPETWWRNRPHLRSGNPDDGGHRKVHPAGYRA